MQDIQTQVIKMFAKNMEFLSSYDENLYKKLAILQQAMETGQYQQNYALEYMDGYFDVQNLHDGSWLYGTNSEEFSQKKADDVNFEKANGSISLTYKNKFTKEMADDFDKMSAINTPASLTAPLEYTIDKLGGRGPSMRKIFKFIFLGVGLGLHVGLINEKIKAKHYLFVEDNLELFYLSLFVCDYESLSKNARLHFCIMETHSGFKTVYDSFFYKDWIQNDFLKFSLFDDSYAPKIKQIQSFVATNPALTYPFSLTLKKNLRISKVLNDGYKFLNISKVHEGSPLGGKKVLFLAAGPSLGVYMDWVKENRDKFIIVAVFMISAKLEKEGIKPDIFVHVDENYEPIEQTLEKMGDFGYFKGIPFLLSASVPLELFEKVTKKENIYLLEDNTGYKAGFSNMEFFSVGEAGYNLSLHLGANELYLLGLDLALDQKTGKTHSHGHSSSDDEKDLSSADTIHEVESLKESVLHVRANRGGEVKTTPLFEMSIHMMNTMSEILQTQKVFNLGDGAYFEKIIPLHVDEVKFDEDVNRDGIDDFLDSISEDELNEKDKNNLLLRRQEVKKKIKALRKFYQHKTKNSAELVKEFLELINQLVKTPNSEIMELRGVFTSYTLFTANFLSEYFNTKDADFSKESILRIKKILHNQLRKIFYIIGLWDFDFLDKSKFLAPQVCKDLEDEVFSFEMTYLNHSQAKEICFEESLKADRDGELLKGVELVPLEEKSGVGFLATYVNLRDKEYVEYLKKILTTLEDASLVAFYFNEYQKDMVGDIFKEFGDRVTCKEVRNVGDVVNGCRILAGNNTTADGFDFYILQYMRNNVVELFAFSPYVKEPKTVLEKENSNKDLFSKLIANLDKFDIFDVPDGKLFHQTYFENVLKVCGFENVKVDINMSYKDFLFSIFLKYALNSNKMIRLINTNNKKIKLLLGR